jgi:hypothetical protein
LIDRAICFLTTITNAFSSKTHSKKTGVNRLWRRLLRLKEQGDFMKYSHKLITLAFAAVLLIGGTVTSASAQRRGVRVINRPVVVRTYVRPYVVRPYYYGYNRLWNYGYYDPFYDPYFSDPYLRAQRQRYYLQQELRGNQRELGKHLEKYNADGVITAKERRELDDDYRDVAKAKRKLAEFERNY